MCVIIINHKAKPIKDSVLVKSSMVNPHGLGVLWLDDYSLTFHDSSEWNVLKTDRPFIAHFRYATVGEVCVENCHPFFMNNDEMLFQNGTVKGLGHEQLTDTEHLAQILSYLPDFHRRSLLATHDCRYVIANRKTKTFQIYNSDKWFKVDGVWFSKNNVLDKGEVIAVYGTLKYGNSNFYNHLEDAKFLGTGYTKKKYEMISRSIPYVLPRDGVGGNIDVELYYVSKFDMTGVDQLEGHPKFYERLETPIVMDDGTEVTAWVYFCEIEVRPEDKLTTSFPGGYRDMPERIRVLVDNWINTPRYQRLNLVKPVYSSADGKWYAEPQRISHYGRQSTIEKLPESSGVSAVCKSDGNVVKMYKEEDPTDFRGYKHVKNTKEREYAEVFCAACGTSMSYDDTCHEYFCHTCGEYEGIINMFFNEN